MHNEVNGHHSIDEDPSHRKPSVKNTDRGKESEEKSDHKVHKIYSFGKVLGEGTFSVVKLCTHRITGEKVAIKILEKSRIKNHEDFERMVREIRILRKIKHPNLIQLYEIHETDDCLYFITEFAGGGELYDYIVKNETLTEAESCHFFHQLVSAIEYLSKLNITHRDIKPENILLDASKNIKLIDFGLGRIYNPDQSLLTACGSPCYAAPEMVARKAYDGTMVDIWSAGITLFAMLCGHLPFDDEDLSCLYKKILAGKFEITSSLVSQEARDLLHGIIEKDPKKRLNIQKIKKHPWMKMRLMFKLQKHIKKAQIELDIDQTVLEVMEANGFDRDQVTYQIEKNRHNVMTTTYHLLLKKKLRMEKQGDEENEVFRRFRLDMAIVIESEMISSQKGEDDTQKDKEIEEDLEEDLEEVSELEGTQSELQRALAQQKGAEEGLNGAVDASSKFSSNKGDACSKRESLRPNTTGGPLDLQQQLSMNSTTAGGNGLANQYQEPATQAGQENNTQGSVRASGLYSDATNRYETDTYETLKSRDEREQVADEIRIEEGVGLAHRKNSNFYSVNADSEEPRGYHRYQNQRKGFDPASLENGVGGQLRYGARGVKSRNGQNGSGEPSETTLAHYKQQLRPSGLGHKRIASLGIDPSEGGVGGLKGGVGKLQHPLYPLNGSGEGLGAGNDAGLERAKTGKNEVVEDIDAQEEDDDAELHEFPTDNEIFSTLDDDRRDRRAREFIDTNNSDSGPEPREVDLGIVSDFSFNPRGQEREEEGPKVVKERRSIFISDGAEEEVEIREMSIEGVNGAKGKAGKGSNSRLTPKELKKVINSIKQGKVKRSQRSGVSGARDGPAERKMAHRRGLDGFGGHIEPNGVHASLDQNLDLDPAERSRQQIEAPITEEYAEKDPLASPIAHQPTPETKNPKNSQTSEQTLVQTPAYKGSILASRIKSKGKRVSPKMIKSIVVQKISSGGKRRNIKAIKSDKNIRGKLGNSSLISDRSMYEKKSLNHSTKPRKPKRLNRAPGLHNTSRQAQQLSVNRDRLINGDSGLYSQMERLNGVYKPGRAAGPKMGSVHSPKSSNRIAGRASKLAHSGQKQRGHNFSSNGNNGKADRSGDSLAIGRTISRNNETPSGGKGGLKQSRLKGLSKRGDQIQPHQTHHLQFSKLQDFKMTKVKKLIDSIVSKKSSVFSDEDHKNWKSRITSNKKFAKKPHNKSNRKKYSKRGSGGYKAPHHKDRHLHSQHQKHKNSSDFKDHLFAFGKRRNKIYPESGRNSDMKDLSRFSSKRGKFQSTNSSKNYKTGAKNGQKEQKPHETKTVISETLNDINELNDLEPSKYGAKEEYLSATHDTKLKYKLQNTKNRKNKKSNKNHDLDSDVYALISGRKKLVKNHFLKQSTEKYAKKSTRKVQRSSHSRKRQIYKKILGLGKESSSGTTIYKSRVSNAGSPQSNSVSKKSDQFMTQERTLKRRLMKLSKGTTDYTNEPKEPHYSNLSILAQPRAQKKLYQNQSTIVGHHLQEGRGSMINSQILNKDPVNTSRDEGYSSSRVKHGYQLFKKNSKYSALNKFVKKKAKRKLKRHNKQPGSTANSSSIAASGLGVRKPKASPKSHLKRKLRLVDNLRISKDHHVASGRAQKLVHQQDVEENSEEYMSFSLQKKTPSGAVGPKSSSTGFSQFQKRKLFKKDGSSTDKKLSKLVVDLKRSMEGKKASSNKKKKKWTAANTSSFRTVRDRSEGMGRDGKSIPNTTSTGDARIVTGKAENEENAKNANFEHLSKNLKSGPIALDFLMVMDHQNFTPTFPSRNQIQSQQNLGQEGEAGRLRSHLEALKDCGLDKLSLPKVSNKMQFGFVNPVSGTEFVQTCVLKGRSCLDFGNYKVDRSYRIFENRLREVF